MKLPLKRLVFYLGLLILSIWILSVYFHFKGNVLYVYTRIAELAKESPSTTDITERSPRQRTTPQNIREFTSMKFGPIFIFGVAAGNTSHKNRWDVFKIYGSLDEKAYGDYNLTCCFKYSSADGDFFQSASPLVRRYYYCRPRLWSYYLACPNKLSLDGFIPTGAAVTFGNYSCGENDVTYVEPYFPYKEPNKIAIGTKLAFANISAEIIIEWMECYKYLGVDKVVTYYLRNINKDALKVLEYYQSTGIMDLSYFEPAFEAKYPRVEKFAKQGTQVYNDQQVVVDDSFERYSGYEYFGIIDFDEFFVPGRYKTLRETLKALSKIYKNPAGFTTLSRYYYTTWGRSSNRSDLILQRYIQREDRKPALECQKNIYTPRRIAYGQVHTHRIGAKEGYKIIAPKLLYKFPILITVPCVVVWIVLSAMLSGISPEVRVFQIKNVLPGVNRETSFTPSVTLHMGPIERGKGFPTHITPASISVVEFLREAQLNDSEVSWLSRQLIKFKANTTKPYLLSLSIADQKKLRNSTAARNLQQYKTRVIQEFKNNSIPLADLDLLKKGPFNFLRNFKSPCWYNDHNQLRCLPFFWFIGTAKSGTSDIYRMLRIHPNFESPFKEYDWLARNRLEIDFDSYTKSVALSFEHQRLLKSKYQLTSSNDSYREAILGDCSPSTMTDNFNWPALEENIHPLEPTYSNADYVYHLNKNARIVIVLRNPINRLFSDYFFHDETGRRTVDDFHGDVVREVDLFNRCMRQYSVWSCCTNWPLVEDFNARLWIGLYVIYLRDWYRLFPQEHIYTLQFEEYTEHRHDIILKLYEFLTLKDISATSSSAEFDEATKSSERSNPNTKRRKDYEINGMRLDTRYILYNFYKPFNEALAHFLNDRSFDYGPF